MFNTLPSNTELDHGKYRITEILGQGGFGITYKAKHLSLDGHVAIKEFYPQEHARREHITGQIVPINSAEAYQRALQRFIREGRYLKRIQHIDNIVTVSDLFEERGTAYLVMELIEGQTLRSLLDEQPNHKLPRSQTGTILEALVTALDAVHQSDIYHLDLKPENILLTAKGGKVKLIDFGAARQGFSSSTTQAYSPAYAAPEVIACQDVGPASDLFELGMVLHEMLTGELPNSATSRLMSLATAQRDSWQIDGLESPWRELLVDALQLNKDHRSQSVKQWWQGAQDYWAREAEKQKEEQRRREEERRRREEEARKREEAERQQREAEAQRREAELRKREEAVRKQTSQTRSQQTSAFFKGLSWCLGISGTIAIGVISFNQFRQTAIVGDLPLASPASATPVSLPNLVCQTIPELPLREQDSFEINGTKFYGEPDYEDGDATKPILNGQGIAVYGDGARYEGDFEAGKRHGCGRLTYPTNNPIFQAYKDYVGQFRQDGLDGVGKLTFASGAYYIGKFKNNACEGAGVFVLADGTRIPGIWTKGESPNKPSCNSPP